MCLEPPGPNTQSVIDWVLRFPPTFSPPRPEATLAVSPNRPPPLPFSPGGQRPRRGLTSKHHPIKPAATPPTKPMASPTGMEITPPKPSPKTSPVTAIHTADCNRPFGIVLLLLCGLHASIGSLRESPKFYKLEGVPTCRHTFT